MISMNLQMLRKRNRMTQEEVAERIDVSRQAVAKWESGDSYPDINNCMALARLFNISLDNLVDDADSKAGPVLPPKGKHNFGTVTVGERGQIVIPKKARELFEINPGDSLMILGDEEKGGLAVMKADYILKMMETFMGGMKPPS